MNRISMERPKNNVEFSMRTMWKFYVSLVKLLE